MKINDETKRPARRPIRLVDVPRGTVFKGEIVNTITHERIRGIFLQLYRRSWMPMRREGNTAIADLHCIALQTENGHPKVWFQDREVLDYEPVEAELTLRPIR